MTPKEKAKKLVDRFAPLAKYWDRYNDGPLEENNAKKCALIAVDLHLEELSKMKLIFSDRELHYNNWRKVKQEIENLKNYE
jgi:hypothetical protein